MKIVIPKSDDEEEDLPDKITNNSTNKNSDTRNFINMFYGNNNPLIGMKSPSKRGSWVMDNFTFPNNCITPFRQVNSTHFNFSSSSKITPLGNSSQLMNFLTTKPHSHNSIQYTNDDNVINIADILTKVEKRTTIMLKFSPVKYLVNELVEELDCVIGLNRNTNIRTYDLVYLPMSFKNEKNLGYAFVNFINPLYVADFFFKITNLKWKKYHTNKNCVIKFAKVQGKKNLISHFKQSPGEEKKPIIFENTTIGFINNYKITLKKEHYGDVCKFWANNIHNFEFI